MRTAGDDWMSDLHGTEVANSLDQLHAFEVRREGDHGRNGPLSPRELQIAHLVARGLTNREIAELLIISTRTVESHVDHIKVKLGFVRRARIVAWVLDPDGDNGARLGRNHCSSPLPNSA